MHSYWFFDLLGIAPTSDTKQIKRAYAVALKAIDQQHERAAFERLRSAYESALAWREASSDSSVQKTDDGDDEEAFPFEGNAQHRGMQAGAEQDSAEQESAEQGSAKDDGASHDDAADGDIVHLDPGQLYVLSEDVGHGLAQHVLHADPGPDDPEPHAAARNDARDLSRQAVVKYVAWLMNPQGASRQTLIDQALRDPELVHLDARHQLSVQLAQALYHAPLGQAELFDLAAARFDWAGQKAFSCRHDRVPEWVSSVIDQTLAWAALPPAKAAAFQAAIDAAASTDQPTPQQCYKHRAALFDLSHDFPAWLQLFLPPGRIDAWRASYDALPEKVLRQMAARRAGAKLLHGVWGAFFGTIKFVVGLFDTWLSRTMLAIMAFSVVVHVFDDDASSTPAQRVSDNIMRLAFANADRAAPRVNTDLQPANGPRPLALGELRSIMNRESCATTHTQLHQRDPKLFGDLAFIDPMGAHAMLCVANNLWPALTDPIVRCLETESWAASNQYRAQDNAHCAQAVVGK